MFFDPANLIWILCVLGVLAIFAGWPRAGGIVYLVAVLFAPVGVFSMTYIRLELALVPLLLGWQAMNGMLHMPSGLVPMVLWGILVIAVSLLTGGDVQPIALYGVLRYIGVALIFTNIRWRECDLVRTQEVFVLSAIPLAILSVGQVLGIPLARWLTENAYYTPNLVVLDLQYEQELKGHMFRAIGTFGNVSPAATYFLTVIGTGIFLLSEHRRSRGNCRKEAIVAGLAAGVLGGVATLSGTFVAGLAPVVAVALLLTRSGSRRRVVAMMALLAALAAVALWVCIGSSDSFAGQLEYQWRRFADGNILQTRYSGDGMVLGDALDEIAESPLFGHGTKVTDTFSGDSLYVLVLYISGIVGCVLFFFGLATFAQASLRIGYAGRLCIIWSAVILLCGVGSNGMLTLRYGDWWWATQGMAVSMATCSAAGIQQRRE